MLLAELLDVSMPNDGRKVGVSDRVGACDMVGDWVGFNVGVLVGFFDGDEVGRYVGLVG